MINLGPYSGSNCPNVHFRPVLLDRVLEAAALILFLVLCGSIYWFYTHRGGTLPHEVWMVWGIAALCSIVLGGCAYLPVRFVRFPVRVTDRNVAVQYLLAVRLVRVVNVILNLTFLSQVYMEYYRWAEPFFGATFVLLIVALIGYYVLAFRYK